MEFVFCRGIAKVMSHVGRGSFSTRNGAFPELLYVVGRIYYVSRFTSNTGQQWPAKNIPMFVF
jgi:hypothetical protein